SLFSPFCFCWLSLGISVQIEKDMVNRRKADIRRIEDRKNKHIVSLMEKHKDAFKAIKHYYYDVTHNNLDLIRQRKDEVIALKKQEHQDEKAMTEIAQANKKLSEP